MQQRLEVSEKRLRETRSEVENVQKRASLHLEAQMRCVQREGGRGVQREGGRGVDWCVTVCVLVLLPPPPPSLSVLLPLLPPSPPFSFPPLVPPSPPSLSSLPLLSLSLSLHFSSPLLRSLSFLFSFFSPTANFMNKKANFRG